MFIDEDAGVAFATWEEVLSYEIDPNGERAELGRRYLEAEAARAARAKALNCESSRIN